jgi:hypothetical protein
VSEDLFENIAYVAWGKIGNRDSRMYKMILFPEKDSEFGWRAALPCNADIIESVTAHYEDYQNEFTLFFEEMQLFCHDWLVQNDVIK